MNFNLGNVYSEFEKYKSIYDFTEYLEEIKENNRIISNFNFIEAKHQIMKLTSKYGVEFNMLALLYQNGKNVVSADSISKADLDLLNDLIYANNHIPLIALARAEIGHAAGAYLSQLDLKKVNRI